MFSGARFTKVATHIRLYETSLHHNKRLEAQNFTSTFVYSQAKLFVSLLYTELQELSIIKILRVFVFSALSYTKISVSVFTYLSGSFSKNELQEIEKNYQAHVNKVHLNSKNSCLKWIRSNSWVFVWWYDFWVQECQIYKDYIQLNITNGQGNIPLLSGHMIEMSNQIISEKGYDA
ncbi:hypothetical protein YC2023_036043 [Brassica napus]